MNWEEVYWLLDSRFDFLLPSFMHEFGIEKQNMVLVNSYHSKTRDDWNKIYIPSKKDQSVIQMEPDDMNRIFSKCLQLDKKNLIISFSGVGLSNSDGLISLTATGEVAEKCNNKWWQYCHFIENQILTPKTYQYYSFEAIRAQFDELVNKHQKIIIKRPCLSGGYRMAVLSSRDDLKDYQAHDSNGDIGQDFLVSEYIPHQQSFAAMGIVRKGGGVSFIPIITEQELYQEVAYEGLLFPAFLSEEYQKEIQQMTVEIGKILEKHGYFGFFNVDYILGRDGLMYAVEINARWGFGTILAACMYGDHFWKIMQGIWTEEIRYPSRRLVIGKIKGKEGREYEGLESHSGITDWFERQKGSFKTFFCGTVETEIFEYGSYIGIFGEFFQREAEKEEILNKFWRSCLEYYR